MWCCLLQLADERYKVIVVRAASCLELKRDYSIVGVDERVVERYKLRGK